MKALRLMGTPSEAFHDLRESPCLCKSLEEILHRLSEDELADYKITGVVLTKKSEKDSIDGFPIVANTASTLKCITSLLNFSNLHFVIKHQILRFRSPEYRLFLCKENNGVKVISENVQNMLRRWRDVGFIKREESGSPPM